MPVDEANRNSFPTLCLRAISDDSVDMVHAVCGFEFFVYSINRLRCGIVVNVMIVGSWRYVAIAMVNVRRRHRKDAGHLVGSAFSLLIC